MLRALWLLLAAALCGAWTAGGGMMPPPYANQPTITVSGNHFLRNGQVWIPKGFNIISTMAPEGMLPPAQAPTQALYGPALYAALQAWDVDTIRFTISEAALAPDAPIYNAVNYVSDLEQKVADARSRGFVVILNLSTLQTSGWWNASWYTPRFADFRAVQVWRFLASLYKNDRGVIFELLNEPFSFTTPANIDPRVPASASPMENGWQVWVWQHQPVIDAIRATGALNTIIVDGLSAAHYLENMPLLHDPTGNIGFAIHPYPATDTFYGYRFFNVAGDMQVHFGDAAATYPVLLTEWYTGTQFSCWDGTNDPNAPATSPQIAQTILDYIQSIGIGLVGYTFDNPPQWTTDSTFSTPTSFHNTPFLCRQTRNDGPGQLVHDYFTTGIAP